MSEQPPLRLGTRRSKLAMTQSGLVATAITEKTGREVTLVEITTYGDTSKEHLSRIGGTGVFVNALRDALHDGDIDLAVHSLKDLPTAKAEGLVLAAVPERADPRDVLVARDGLTLHALPSDAKVGTGATRRVAQLRSIRPELKVVPIRGNVDTRIGFVTSGELDAVMIAAAGIARLGRLDEATELFEPDMILPSPGQGALAVECREDDADLVALLSVLDHRTTRAATLAERALLADLGAGCSAPVGAFASVPENDSSSLHLSAVVASGDGTRTVRLSTTGRLDEPVQLGRGLAAEMLAQGAAGLIGERVP